jgi:hypothetical protein
MSDTDPVSPSFLAIAPAEKGWWLALEYENPGMVVPFDGVNGVPAEKAINTPIYAIDTTVDDDVTEGLYLVASGCLIDVDRLGSQLEQTRASDRSLDQLSMLDFITTGTVLPLTERSAFRLPPQEVGSKLTINRNEQKISPDGKASKIKRIEADLRPYGVHSGQDAIKFAAKLGIRALGVEDNGVVKGDLGGTPLTRAVRRLNYALVSPEEQEKMRRPLNKGEVVDAVRSFIFSKLNDPKTRPK